MCMWMDRCMCIHTVLRDDGFRLTTPTHLAANALTTAESLLEWASHSVNSHHFLCKYSSVFVTMHARN